MINAKEHYVGWARLVTELDEAREHLEKLIGELASQGLIEESDFAVQLAHVFAHLNRAWHSRQQDSEISDQQWKAYSQFPTYLNPVG